VRLLQKSSAAFLLAALFAAAVLSCSVKSLPTRNYYLITYTPGKMALQGSRRPYPFALQVAPFAIQRIYDRQNILYRFSPNQIQYYEIERWAVRPDIMLTDVAFTHLESSGLVNRVGVTFLDSRPDFRLEGTVLAIEKFDAGDLFFAHLAMSFKLLRASSGTQVWEYEFDEREQVFQREMVYTVHSLSSIFEKQMNTVVAQLDSLFLSMDRRGPAAGEGTGAAPHPRSESAPSDSAKEDPGYRIIREER
jgi:ABC-type uncharacterized transport system auxiliary subunit